MTYVELYKIICNPWIKVDDIKKIASCGRDNAIKIRNLIEQQIISSGKTLPQCKTKYVPTRLVLEYLNLDPNYIAEMALQQKKVLSLCSRS